MEAGDATKVTGLLPQTGLGVAVKVGVTGVPILATVVWVVEHPPVVVMVRLIVYVPCVAYVKLGVAVLVPEELVAAGLELHA